MTDDVKVQIDNALEKRRAELEALSLHEVGQEFHLAFGIRPDLSAGKENLIVRTLAKARAELQRNA